MAGCISGGFSYDSGQQAVFETAVKRKVLSNHGRLINNCSGDTTFDKFKAAWQLAKDRAVSFVPSTLVYKRSRVEQERKFGEVALEQLYAKVMSDFPTDGLQGDRLESALNKQSKKIAFFLDEISEDELGEQFDKESLVTEKAQFWKDFAKSKKANAHFNGDAFAYSHPDLDAFSRTKRSIIKAARFEGQSTQLFLLKYNGTAEMCNAAGNKSKTARTTSTPLLIAAGLSAALMIGDATWSVADSIIKEGFAPLKHLGGMLFLGYSAQSALRAGMASRGYLATKSKNANPSQELNAKEAYIAQQGKLAAREMFITLTRNANALRQSESNSSQSLRSEAEIYVKRKAKDYETALNTKLSRLSGDQLRNGSGKLVAEEIQTEAAKRFLGESADSADADPLSDMSHMIKTALKTLHDKKVELVEHAANNRVDEGATLLGNTSRSVDDFTNRKLARYVTLGMRHALGLSSGGKSPALLNAASKELGSLKVNTEASPAIETDLVPDATGADTHLATKVGKTAWKTKQTIQTTLGFAFAYAARPIGGAGVKNIHSSSEEFSGVSKVMMKCARWCTSGVKADELYSNKYKQLAANFKKQSEKRTSPEFAHLQFGTANHALQNPHQYGATTRFLVNSYNTLMKTSDAVRKVFTTNSRIAAAATRMLSNNMDRGFASSIGYVFASTISTQMLSNLGPFALFSVGLPLWLGKIAVVGTYKAMGPSLALIPLSLAFVPALLLTFSSRMDFRGDLLPPQTA